MPDQGYAGQNIRLTLHAAGYFVRRGFSASEVEEAIKSQEWVDSEKGRLECKLNAAYEKEWNGKYYALKQIRPIFVVERDEIIVITVYTYYF